jgi:hypothetical protein
MVAAEHADDWRNNKPSLIGWSTSLGSWLQRGEDVLLTHKHYVVFEDEAYQCFDLAKK